MNIRPRFFIGAGLIILAIGYLIGNAMRTTSEYYLTVSEVAARQSELGGQALRVAGRVKPGTVNWEPNTLTLKFEIVPIPDLNADAAPIKPVVATDARLVPRRSGRRAQARHVRARPRRYRGGQARRGRRYHRDAGDDQLRFQIQAQTSTIAAGFTDAGTW